MFVFHGAEHREMRGRQFLVRFRARKRGKAVPGKRTFPKFICFVVGSGHVTVAKQHDLLCIRGRSSLDCL
jgi:hypothetical protein